MRLVTGFASSLLLVGLVLAGPAGAQTLTGEQFVGAVRVLNVHCPDPLSESHFRYEAIAAAVGPYPGTATETGKVTIGPQDDPVSVNPVGPVLRLKANFEITDAQGRVTVTGKKRLITPLPASASSQGVCIDHGDFGATVLAILQEGNVCYEAKVRETNTTDQGVSQLIVGVLPTIGANLFSETFTSDRTLDCRVRKDED